MKITILFDGHRKQCDVSQPDCRKLRCFAPGYFIRYKGNEVVKDTNLSCLNREYRGCPDDLVKRSKK
jgi:hypothetical protein